MEHEVTLVVQYLLHILDTPVCLIGITPDEDSLPHFLPALYQEPKDTEDYVEIVVKLKAWRVTFKNNHSLMEQMFESAYQDIESQTATPDHFKDILANVHATFQQWAILQKKLIGHCNDFTSVECGCQQNSKPKKTTTIMEREIVEQLM